MSRQTIFQAIYNALNSSPPTYTWNSTTYTYTILSAFPDTNPVFPCIVINPATKNTTSLGVAWTTDKRSAKVNVNIDFYAPVSHGKGAIDSARDTVEALIGNLKSSTFYLTHDPFEDTEVDKMEYNDQTLNTATMMVYMTAR